MTKSLKLLLFAIIVLAIIMAARLFVSNGKASLKHYPSVKALGATVRLDDVNQMPDGRVKVQLTISSPQTMPQLEWFRYGETLLEYNGQQFQTDEGGVNSDDGLNYTSTACFGLPRGAKAVTVLQKVYLNRPEKRLRMKFDNVSLTGIPMTRKANGCVVTLRQILPNQIPDLNDWYSSYYEGSNEPAKDKKPRFWIEMEEQYVPDYEDDGGITITGSDGQSWQSDCAFSHDLGPQKPLVFSGSVPVIKPNKAEQAVGLVSPKTMVWMLNKRLSQQMQNQTSPMTPPEATHKLSLYRFPCIKNPPRRFSFEIQGQLPPDKKDVVWVRFKNIPIR